MDAWRSLGELAEFPGTLVLEDARPENEAYSSEAVTPESLHLLEPGLSPHAASSGARLYRQEGKLLQCICQISMLVVGLHWHAKSLTMCSLRFLVYLKCFCKADLCAISVS